MKIRTGWNPVWTWIVCGPCAHENVSEDCLRLTVKLCLCSMQCHFQMDEFEDSVWLFVNTKLLTRTRLELEQDIYLLETWT